MGLPNLPDTRTYELMFGKYKQQGRANKGPALARSLANTIRAIDIQDAIRRVRWYNLPYGVTDSLVERIMYYRTSALFFYMEANDRFYLLPYTGKGLDVVGRYETATPLPFNGASDKKNASRPWIEGLDFVIQHDVVPPERLTAEVMRKSGVILNDYSLQVSQKNIPRSELQTPIIELMSEMLPLARTALMNGVGLEGVKVDNQDEAMSVALASEAAETAALNGDKWIAVQGNFQTETLTREQPTKVEDYLLYMQSLDNLRLSAHGLQNGGLFEKKAHVLQSEQDMNSGIAGMVLQDCIAQRQQFCNIVNSIWGLGIWCEPTEVAMDGDLNGDGVVYDEDESAVSGASAPSQEDNV